MAKKARKIALNSKEIRSIKKELNSLNFSKNDLLDDLQAVENRYNSLSSLAQTEDEWFYSLPINSLKDLSSFSKSSLNMSLKSLKERSLLRKSSKEMIESIKKVELEINLKKIDLLAAKVNTLLNKIQ